jgi:hypothetical protein
MHCSYKFSYKLKGANPLYLKGIEVNVKVTLEGVGHTPLFRVEVYAGKHGVARYVSSFGDAKTVGLRLMNEIIDLSKEVVIFRYLPKERGFRIPRTPQEAEELKREGYVEKVEEIKRIIEESVRKSKISEKLKDLLSSLYKAREQLI